MNYNEALEWMESLSKKGIHPGLEGISSLLSRLDHPEKNTKFIHVAGTNGKGSTARFISCILRAAGYKVGLYSSPKVFSETEIIEVNGRPISKADYARLTDLIKAHESLGFTRFEAETAMAFLFFNEKEVDYAIIECGMGGLLDATNVIQNTELAVFTSIGLDHTEYLGDTVEKIAENKAGIIKPGTYSLIGVNEPSVVEVISRKSEKVYAVSEDNIKNIKGFKEYTKFDYRNFKGLKINLISEYQVKNAALSVEAALALRDRGLNISDRDIFAGLEKMSIPGRFEVISKKPLFVIDGAHNEPASLELVKNIKAHFTKKEIVYIMGMFRDKDVERVVENTAPYASQILTVTLPNKARSLSAFELAETVKKYNKNVSSIDSIEEAVEIALLMASQDEDICILAFGSLSHLSRIKDAVNNKNNKRTVRI